MKNYLKLGVFLFGVSIVLTNCLRDNTLEHSQKRVNVKKISFKDFKQKQQVNDALLKFEKHLDYYKSAHKSLSKVNAIDSTFNILTDEIIEVVTDSTEAYTFRIETPTHTVSLFENFVIEKFNNGTYKFYIYRYRENIETRLSNENVILMSRELIDNSRIDLDDFNDYIAQKIIYDETTGCLFSLEQDEDCSCEYLYVLQCDNINPGGGGSYGDGSYGSGGDGSYGYGGSPQGVIGVIGDSNNNLNVKNAIRDFLNSLSTEDSDCLTPQIGIELTDFLQNNANPEITVDGEIIPANIIAFVEQAIEAVCGGGEVDFDNQIIITPDLAIDYPCQAQVVLDTLNTNSPLTNSISDVFNVESSEYDLSFNYDENLHFPTSGVTNWTSEDSQWNLGLLEINIRLSIDLMNSSDLGIAMIVIHESLHANLLYLVETGQITNTNTNNNLSSLADEYATALSMNQITSGLEDISRLEELQHEYIAEIVNQLVDTITSYGESKNYNLPVNYYEALAWTGLTGTNEYLDIVNDSDDGDQDATDLINKITEVQNNEFHNINNNANGTICPN